MNKDRRRFFRKNELLYDNWNSKRVRSYKKKKVEVAIGIGEQEGAEENESGH